MIWFWKSVTAKVFVSNKKCENSIFHEVYLVGLEGTSCV